MSSPTTQTPKDISQLKNYIAQLQIPAPPPSLLALNLSPKQSDDAKAAVDNAMIITFAPGMSSQHRDDVKNSTLLAALAANFQFSPFNDTENWYKAYVAVLQNIGWDLANLNFTQLSGSGGSFEVDKIVLNVLQSIAGGQIDAVTAVLKAMSDSSNNDALKLFDHNSVSGQSGNFQAAVATEDTDGNVQLAIGTFFFSTKESVDKVLWFKFSLSDTNFFQAAQSFVLDEDVYAQVRNDVIKKLGSNASKFVTDINI